MSRCFPYPPLGNAPSRASKDALIESIKFQNECVKSIGPNEKSNDQNKEKRRIKKEKRKEKKDKTHLNTDKSILVQAHFSEKHWSGTKAELLSKESILGPEQLEQSIVTEEHGEPACLVAPSTSSDSTANNCNKRKRYSSPVDVTRGHGKIIRLRIPLKKTKTEEQHGSIFGSTNIPSQNEHVPFRSCRNDGDKICSTSQPIETTKISKPLIIEAVMTPMRRAEFHYTNLMDSLVMPQPLNCADDLDWLLNGKFQETCAEQKSEYGNEGIACSLNWGLWPRVNYSQDVDLYALPFTIPF